MTEQIPDEVTRFRQEYRSLEIAPGYNGWGHLLFTSGLSLLIVAVCIGQLSDVRSLEWLTIPVAFAYANLSEYWGHRGPMHRPFKGLRMIYRRHAGQHHLFFTDQAMAFESSRDFSAVLFPPGLVLFFFGLFGLPVWALMVWLFSANVAWLFVATAVGYFLNYEWLHFAYHCRQDSWVFSIPGLRGLRHLHLKHHDQGLMTRYNFNISYPIADLLFGTFYRGSKDESQERQIG